MLAGVAEEYVDCGYRGELDKEAALGPVVVAVEEPVGGLKTPLNAC